MLKGEVAQSLNNADPEGLCASVVGTALSHPLIVGIWEMTTSHTEGVPKGGEYLCPTPLSGTRTILHLIPIQENLKESTDLR